MNITLLSGKAVVASFRQHHVEGIEGIVSLQIELLRRFKFCATLHFDADKPCYIRVLVRSDENAQALADEIAAVIREHMPLATDPSAVKMRIVTAPEFGKDDAEQMTELAALQAEVTRYKQAAEALWKLLDDIDTADDAARDDDARYRGSARTIAKRRSEHAQSFDGQTLVWSWHSPLPAADFAKLEIDVLQGTATDDEVTEYKRLVLLHTPPDPGELPPELLDVAAQQLNAVTHGPSPGFLERFAEAAKTATADNPAFIEVEPEKYDAADCIRIPPVEFPATSVHHAKTPSAELPPEFYDGTSAALEKGLTSEEVADALEYKGVLIGQDEPAAYRLGTFEKAEFPPELIKTATLYEAGQPIDIDGAPAGYAPVAAIAKRKLEADYDRISAEAPVFAAVADALEAVDPANPDFTPAFDLLADAELPPDEEDDHGDPRDGW